MKIFICTILISIASVCSGQKVKRNIVQNIPNLSIYNINRDTVDLKTLTQNKVTIVDFWFIPCGPCFEEMNMLHTLYAKYKDDPKVCFLTITITDSSFVRPLIENRITSTNDTYEYFKTLSKLDTFKLPVFFIKDVSSKMKSFKKTGRGFSGQYEPNSQDPFSYTENVFGFSAYPTILVFDMNGKTIYNKTGFAKVVEKQQLKKIEEVVRKNL